MSIEQVKFQAHKILIWSQLNPANHHMLLKTLSDRLRKAAFNSSPIIGPTSPTCAPMDFQAHVTSSCKDSFQWATESSYCICHQTLKPYPRLLKIQMWTYWLLNVILSFQLIVCWSSCLYLRIPGWLIQLAIHHFPTWFRLHLLDSREVVEEI